MRLETVKSQCEMLSQLAVARVHMCGVAWRMCVYLYVSVVFISFVISDALLQR